MAMKIRRRGDIRWLPGEVRTQGARAPASTTQTKVWSLQLVEGWKFLSLPFFFNIKGSHSTIVTLAFWMKNWIKVVAPAPCNQWRSSRGHILWSPWNANMATTRATVPVTLEQARGSLLFTLLPFPPFEMKNPWEEPFVGDWAYLIFKIPEALLDNKNVPILGYIFLAEAENRKQSCTCWVNPEWRSFSFPNFSPVKVFPQCFDDSGSVASLRPRLYSPGSL